MTCVLLDLSRPFQLPHREIGIAMEAEQHAGCCSRIPDDESDQLLPISSARSALARIRPGLHSALGG